MRKIRKTAKGRPFVAFFVAILVTSVFFTNTICANPSGVTTLYFDPSNIVVEYGETFTVCLKISEVADLKAFGIRVSYDTEMLDALESFVVPFLNEPAYVYKNEIDEAAGVIHIAVFSGAEGANGNGTLAVITFKATLSGECPLSFYSTSLADSNVPPRPIPHEKVNGHVIVTGSTRLYIDPFEILVSTDEEFTVYVKLDNFRNLYGFDVRIEYDTVFLDLIETKLLPKNFVSGGSAGFIWAVWVPPKSGSLKLASLTFKAKAEGTCTIHIYLHKLATVVPIGHVYGVVGYPIAHSVEDGYCTIGPLAGIENLIVAIESWDLDGGFERSLTAKLDDAINLLNQGNVIGAIHKLQDLIKKASNDAKYLTQEQKDYIILKAEQIIELIK